MAASRLEIKNPVGFNTELDPSDVAQNTWTLVENASFKNGKSYRAGGPNFTAFRGTYLGSPSSLDIDFQAEDQDGSVWYNFSYDSIKKLKSGVITDVSRTTGGAYTGPLFDAWSITNLNTVVVATNGVDLPQSKIQSEATFKNLPNWPTNTICKTIKSYKNYLVAMNITTGGVNYPSTVKWSSPADPGQVPFSWDVASITSDAGENPLSDSTGSLVDGLALRDSFILYKDTSVYSMNYVGGVYIFSFRKLFDNAGILAAGCVAEFDDGHFVFGQNDVYVHNGVQKQSVIYGKVKDELFSRINRSFANKCFVVSDPSRNEIWCCYPALSSGGSYAFCTEAFVWNWVENTWAIRVLPVARNSAVFGVITPVVETWATVQTSKTWSIARTPWNYVASGASNKGLIFGPTFYEETSPAQSSNLVSRFIKTGINLGDDQGIKVCTSVAPHFSGDSTGTVQITVGYQQTQDGDVTWGDTRSFVVGTEYKFDCRVSGRYLAIKFEFPYDSLLQLSGFSAELQSVAGIR